MATEKIVVGRALAAKTGSIGFVDPAWDERMLILLRLTQRTQLIQELTGTNVATHRIVKMTNQRMLELGLEIARPRGRGQNCMSATFLQSLAQKYDAAYLIALHFGSNGAGGSAVAETNLGLALDKRIAVYLRYRKDLYENSDDARISFETYVILIAGIKTRDVQVLTCEDCSSRYPWQSKVAATPYCPICAMHQHKVGKVKGVLTRLLTNQNSLQQTRYAGH